MVTPCVMDAAAIYGELQTCIEELENGARLDKIHEKIVVLQGKIPIDHSLGLLVRFAEKKFMEITKTAALDRLKNLGELIQCTYGLTSPSEVHSGTRELSTPCFSALPSPASPICSEAPLMAACFPLLPSPSTSPPSPCSITITDSELALLRIEVEKVKNEKRVVRKRCLAVMQFIRENDLLIKRHHSVIQLSMDQLKNRIEMLNRAKQAVCLVQKAAEGQDKVIEKHKADFKTLVIKRPSPASRIDTAWERCLLELRQAFSDASQRSVQFSIPNWSKWDASKEPVRTSSAHPTKAWGLNWFLQVKKHEDGIALHLCQTDPLEEEITVIYRLSIKHRVTNESILNSKCYEAKFGNVKTYGLSLFTILEEAAEAGGYIPAEDTLTFFCKIYPLKGLLWGRNR